MSTNRQNEQSVWFQNGKLQVIDQKILPFQYRTISIDSSDETIRIIKDMTVRGAPVIGACAAFGVYFAFMEARSSLSFDTSFKKKTSEIKNARPTAVNLMYAVDWMCEKIQSNTEPSEVLNMAKAYAQKDIDDCFHIGNYGVKLIQDIYDKKQDTINILTHCNAGWLATGKYGTATAPIYLAHKQGIPVHVWVDETRPRNQGANLTAWELQQSKVPFTIIADNTGGHLMQHQQVDMVIVGSDRTSVNGDVANKVGTYLKALAAYDNQIPFYVALPTSTIDFELEDGVANIPVEERCGRELNHIKGLDRNSNIQEVQIYPTNAQVANYAFDVTPAKYISGLITEKGIVQANKTSILSLTTQ